VTSKLDSRIAYVFDVEIDPERRREGLAYRALLLRRPNVHPRNREDTI